MQLNTSNRQSILWMEWVWAIVIALVLIGAMDMLTNQIDTTLFDGDFVYYLDMAENGIFENSHLAAPFAYRPLVPFMARSLADLFGGSLETGFRIVAWLGALLTLVSSYVLARTFGAEHKLALFIMIIIAGSFFHLKYLLFDVYRPDHLAYGLLIVAFLALLHKQWLACIIVSAIGLLTREFCIIPLVLMLLQLLMKVWQGQKQRGMNMIWITIGVLVILAFVLLPRLLLPIEMTFVYATLFKPDPTAIETVTLPLTSIRRNLNLLFAMIAYILPLIWLAGWAQLKEAWHSLGELRWLVGGYMLMVLGLTLIGGTDLARFVTYLHIPLIIFSAILLKHDTPRILLVGLFGTLIIFNRLPFQIPQENYNHFIDFYGAYHDRINPAIIARWQELIVFLFLAVGIRGGLAIIARERDAKIAATES